MVSKKWYKPLPSHTISKEGLDNAILQILNEEDSNQLEFLTAKLRKYYSKQDIQMALEAIMEERQKKVRSVVNVYRLFKEKLKKRKSERNKRKDIKKRAKKKKG